MPRDRSDAAALSAVREAVLAITSEVGINLDHVLQRLADAARRLVGARYAAIGVPDGSGGFSHFVTAGVDDATVAAIGWLPRTHGLLGLMLDEPEPFIIEDVRTHPRFRGWPDAHPEMDAMLGMPVVSRGGVVGAFYLTNKEGGFEAEDRRLMELLAAHAAIAIENARLFDASRELSILSERERLARELHDAMSQTLFSMNLTAETAADLVDSDPGRAREHLEELRGMTRSVLSELRSLVLDLRPPDLERDGLVETLRKQLDVLSHVHGVDIRLSAGAATRFAPDVELHAFRVAQEALTNALRHAGAERIDVEVDSHGDVLVLEVRDDGAGFDPEARGIRARSLGLSSMRHRAREVGGQLTIDTRPGAGTRVRLEVPHV
ncbi:MAG: GAF domain-containing sensor histidine kinase [Actinomycetota bacterium]|nr:GAF domain-containing sensor histidine kinase [Actinomycetota bacterium]